MFKKIILQEEALTLSLFALKISSYFNIDIDFAIFDAFFNFLSLS